MPNVKVRKNSNVSSEVDGRPGIFGINKQVGMVLKAAGGSPGYDPFTKSIALKGVTSPTHRPIPKTVYVGHGGGKTGAIAK